jgi:hypothetical protein
MSALAICPNGDRPSKLKFEVGCVDWSRVQVETGTLCGGPLTVGYFGNGGVGYRGFGKGSSRFQVDGAASLNCTASLRLEYMYLSWWSLTL